MHSKPTTSEQDTNRSQEARNPSAVLTGGTLSSHLDIARAEAEGMGQTPPEAAMSGDSQRHQARNSALSQNMMVFDLASESKQLTLPFDATHTARTLAKLDTIRLTLMRLSANSSISEHKVAHQVSLQTVSGHVVVRVEQQPVEMPAGHVMVLARGIAHDVVALEDSVVLITVSAS